MPPVARTKMRPSGKPAYDRRHRVASRDGWPLAIYEYRPAEGVPSKPYPVLCCHGANCRYGIYDSGDGFGLAPWLAARGYHVFAADLRGRGLSAPRATLRRFRALVGRGWTLGDFLKKDLPTLFEFVLASTGAEQLDLVGHSLGGMLALELLARNDEPRVRRLVTVGAGDGRAMLLREPKTRDASAQHQGRGQVYVGMLMAPFALSSRYAPVHWGARLGAIMMPLAPDGAMDGMLSALLNASNMEPHVLRDFLRRSLSGISSKKFWSFGAMIQRLNREQQPARHRVAALHLAGSGDRLVPPDKVRATASRSLNPHTRVVEFSLANGHAADYGHIDLLLGRHVEREVFPHIDQWLSEQWAQLAERSVHTGSKTTP